MSQKKQIKPETGEHQGIIIIYYLIGGMQNVKFLWTKHQLTGQGDHQGQLHTKPVAR